MRNFLARLASWRLKMVLMRLPCPLLQGVLTIPTPADYHENVIDHEHRDTDPFCHTHYFH